MTISTGTKTREKKTVMHAQQTCEQDYTSQLNIRIQYLKLEKLIHFTIEYKHR
jgi:hypothetical protein